MYGYVLGGIVFFYMHLPLKIRNFYKALLSPNILMALSQLRSTRKPTGGRYKAGFRKKRLYELGREPSFTGLGAKRIKIIRVRGDNQKARLLSGDIANLYDPKAKKYEQVKIKTISGNPANRHFVRRNIMTKGAIIETDKGKARITSRPGQDGSINAVLVQ